MTSLEDLGLDPNAMLTALYKARATGTRRIEYTDGNQSRTVEYKSDADLAAAIAAIEGKVAGAAGRSVNVVSIRSEKGWL